jgi:hypothetical protein
VTLCSGRAYNTNQPPYGSAAQRRAQPQLRLSTADSDAAEKRLDWQELSYGKRDGPEEKDDLNGRDSQDVADWRDNHHDALYNHSPCNENASELLCIAVR